MASTEMKALEVKIIDLKIRNDFSFEDQKNLKSKLDEFKIQWTDDELKNYIIIKLPIDLIFYVEYQTKKVLFFTKIENLVLIDESYTTLLEISIQINKQIDNQNVWSKFIRIADRYLVRKGNIKGYDYNDGEILLYSISHSIQNAKLTLGRTYLKEVYETIELASKKLLLIKSTENIEYIVNPAHIKCIANTSDLKKIYFKDDYFIPLIIIKESASFHKLKEYFNNNNKEYLKDGFFIKLTKEIYYNLSYFNKDLVENNLYKDPICGTIKIDKKVLKELELTN